VSVLQSNCRLLDTPEGLAYVGETGRTSVAGNKISLRDSGNYDAKI